MNNYPGLAGRADPILGPCSHIKSMARLAFPESDVALRDGMDSQNPHHILIGYRRILTELVAGKNRIDLAGRINKLLKKPCGLK